MIMRHNISRMLQGKVSYVGQCGNMLNTMLEDAFHFSTEVLIFVLIQQICRVDSIMSFVRKNIDNWNKY